MKIAIVGGGPGGLYFAALMKQLDPSHDITLWERNAATDTFGFGVVFSDETLGGIGNADPVVAEYMSRRFARWNDESVRTPSSGFSFSKSAVVNNGIVTGNGRSAVNARARAARSRSAYSISCWSRSISSTGT